ncbi:cytochrome P450 [Streptomyces sp. NPDC050625]|uniref:cytochrome P450 n=1 Tax=Streptomyces sp. NPDC050625 TaxID=3154629 RepID=UPI003423FDE5
MMNQANPHAGWDLSSGVNLERYDEVEEVLRRSRDFNLEGTKAESLEFVGGTLVAIDGRPHLNRRKALSRMLSPKMPWGAEGTAFEAVFAHYAALTRASAEPGATEVRFDLLDFAARVYWRLVAGMIGVDQIESEADIERFRELATHIVMGITVEYVADELKDEILENARAAVAKIREEVYVPSFQRRLELVREAGDDLAKKDALPGDLITSMIAVEDDLDAIDDTAIFREMVELMAGSINNPVAMAAYGLDDVIPWLDKHPEDLERLQDRTFLNGAIAESLRLHRATRPYLARIANKDVVLETGREIKEGDWVYSWLGPADRDASVFGDDFDAYDPYRKALKGKVPGFGLAFGTGAHMCLGRPILIWEQGGNEAQGVLVKMLRLQLESGMRPDPEGVQQESAGAEGGKRFVRYDVVMPVQA